MEFIEDLQTLSPARRVIELVDRIARVSQGGQFCCGLNPAQWEALRYLSRANRYSRTPSAIAEYLGTTKGTASQTLNALEAKGLVRRMRAKRDRRSLEVEITEPGVDLLKEDPFAKFDQASVGEEAGDGEVLVTGLRNLLRDMRLQQGLPEFGICKTCCHLGECDQSSSKTDSCSCGLTGEILSVSDTSRLCINHSSSR